MITSFLGHLHPILLHLPIGIFSLAFVLFYFNPDKSVRLSKQLGFILLLSWISAILSAASGFLLNTSGEYNEQAAETHQWLAIAFTILCGCVYFLHRYILKTNQIHKAFQPVFIAALIAMVFTGHAGGSLTHGADFLRPQQEETEKHVKDTVRQMLQVATTELPNGPKLPVVAPVDTALIKELKASGFTIRLLAEGSGWLDVSTINMNTLTQQQFEQLVRISANIYGLSLANQQLTGIDLKLIGKLTQLRRLDIRNTPLGDSFLSVLSNLENLEYLNLVGTTVSDEGLKYIVQLKGLRKVYCWNSQISVEAINNLKLKYPQLSIITGL